MLGKYLEEGGGYQALSATTCATVVPLWGHLDENHLGDDGDNSKNNDEDAHPACEKDILASLEVELFRSLPSPVMQHQPFGSIMIKCKVNTYHL